MASSSEQILTALETVLQGHPAIKYAKPSSANYSSFRETFSLDNPAVPLAIVRPQTSDDVATIVEYAREHGVKPVVRSGGNSLFGKSMVQDALIIDMRDIAYVNIDKTKKSARVGGGILLGELADQLAKEGLATAVGTMPFVGFVGWSTYGGYGPFSAQYGLGCDNVIGAKVVNWRGEVIEADQSMLKGIRGAGGAFGPIVELTIKLYPLRNILAGMIVYDSTDITTTVQSFNTRYRELSAKGLPPALNVQQFALNMPQGKAFSCCFIWGSDDHETGREYLAKIASFGSVVMNTVAPSTTAGFMQFLGSLVSPHAYGSISTISIRELTPEVTAIIGRNLEMMPSAVGAAFSIHQLRGPSAAPNSESVFGSREPHMMFELIQTVAVEADLRKTQEWASGFLDELHKVDQGNILPGTYISITPPGSNSFANIFGSAYDTLLELKRKYDPEGTFSLAQPEVHTLKN